jgi:hypothetical protein
MAFPHRDGPCFTRRTVVPVGVCHPRCATPAQPDGFRL